MKTLKILALILMFGTANAEIINTNGLDNSVRNVNMHASMRNGSLKISFGYYDQNGSDVLWSGRAATQCAVYENNGNILKPIMGTKRAWTRNIKLKSYRQDVIMNNIYVGDYETDTAILQCYIKLRKYSNNLRTVFILHGI